MRDNIILILAISYITIKSWMAWRLLRFGYYAVDTIVNTIKCNTSAYQRDADGVPKYTQGAGKSKIEVGQLSPDILAPQLKNPPRSPGGFGSKVQ